MLLLAGNGRQEHGPGEINKWAADKSVIHTICISGDQISGARPEGHILSICGDETSGTVPVAWIAVGGDTGDGCFPGLAVVHQNIEIITSSCNLGIKCYVLTVC